MHWPRVSQTGQVPFVAGDKNVCPTSSIVKVKRGETVEKSFTRPSTNRPHVPLGRVGWLWPIGRGGILGNSL